MMNSGARGSTKRRVDALNAASIALCIPVRGSIAEAVCIDLGVSARGETPSAAREELARVIEDLIDVACEQGRLEYLLCAPDNSAALKQYKRWNSAFHIVLFLIAPITVAWRIKRFIESMFQTYDQAFNHVASTSVLV